MVVADYELRGAATDVDHDRWLARAGRLGAAAVEHRSEEGELRLFLTAEHARIEVVVTTNACCEAGSVGCLAHGRCEHGEVGAASMRVDRLSVLVERAEHASDRLPRERAARVHAVAETGHARASQHFLDRAAARVDVGDQQARGVGSHVDDRYVHRPDARACSP